MEAEPTIRKESTTGLEGYIFIPVLVQISSAEYKALKLCEKACRNYKRNMNRGESPDVYYEVQAAIDALDKAKSGI